MGGRGGVGCVWLGTTHLAYSSQAPYAAALNKAQGKEQPLPTRTSSSNEGRQSSKPTPHAKKDHTRRTPRDTNQAGQEHCCLSIIRKTKHSPKRQHAGITSKLHAEKKQHWIKRTLILCPQKNPNWCQTLAPGIPISWTQWKGWEMEETPSGSLPDQTCWHHWTAGWLSGLWWSSPWPSYSGEVPEIRIGFMSMYGKNHYSIVK